MASPQPSHLFTAFTASLPSPSPAFRLHKCSTASPISTPSESRVQIRKRLRTPPTSALHRPPATGDSRDPSRPLAKSRPPRASGTAIDAAISAGALSLLPELVRRDLSTLSYGAILRAVSALVSARHWTHVIQVYEDAARSDSIKCRFTTRLYTDLFFSLMKLATPVAAARGYEEWTLLVKQRIDAKLLGPRAYNFLFVSLSRAGMVDEAMDVRSNCVRNGFYLNRYSYNAFLNACAKSYRIADAFETLREMAESNVLPDVVSFNVLIACCVRSGDLDIALGILHRMKDWGISPDIYSYNSVVNGLRKNKMLEDAFELVAQMEADAANGDNVPLVTELVNQNGLPYDNYDGVHGGQDGSVRTHTEEVTSHAKAAAPLIHALTTARRAKHNDTASGSPKTNALDSQQGDVHGSNDEAGGAGSDAWAKEGSGEEKDGNDDGQGNDAVDHQDIDGQASSHESGVSPDLVTYNTLISGLAGLDSPDFARALLVKKHMEGRGVICNEVSYNALMAVAARASEIQAAFDIYDEMISRALKPNCECFTTLITLCGRANMIERAFQMHDHMIASGIKPSVVTFNALLTACRCTAGRDSGEAALRVLKEMQSTPGCKPDVITYSTIIDALGRGGRFSQVREVLDEMSNEGIEPNLVTYTSVISALTRAGDLEGALRVLDDMEEHGIKPNVYTFSSLIHGAGRRGQFRRALEMLEMMRDRGIMASRVTYCMLLQLAVKSKERELLDHIVDVLRKDRRLKGTPQMVRILELSKDTEVFVTGKGKKIVGRMNEAVEECIASPRGRKSSRVDRATRAR